MTITTQHLKSALVTIVLMGIAAASAFIIRAGGIFNLSWHDLVNTVVVAMLTGVVSLIQTAGTDENGVFAGMIKVGGATINNNPVGEGGGSGGGSNLKE